MDEVRITIDGTHVKVSTTLSKKKLLEILDKAKLQVHLAIAQEKANELIGSRWKNINEESFEYHQTMTIQSINKDVVTVKYDFDENEKNYTVDELSNIAIMVDE